MNAECSRCDGSNCVQIPHDGMNVPLKALCGFLSCFSQAERR